MALDKRNLAIPFATGIDTKTDPLQVMPMNLIDLQNAVFTSDKRIQKRNGYQQLTALPSGVFPTTLTTFNGNLTVIGNSLQAYNENNASWVNHGRYQPVKLSVLPLTRASSGQSAADVAFLGTLVTTTFLDTDGTWYYQINDSLTGQQILDRVALPGDGQQARVFALGNIFVITFLQTVTATPHLRYIVIPAASLVAGSPVDISTQVDSVTAAYDGQVADGNLYIAWNGSDVGGAIRYTYMTSAMGIATTKTIASQTADVLSLSATGPINYITWFDSGATETKTFAFNTILNQVLAPTVVDSTDVILHLATSIDDSGTVHIYSEVDNNYSFSPNNPSHYITANTVTMAGVVGTKTTILRSVGLASKVFTINSVNYMLVAYQGQYQPTYFLMDATGAVVARFASSNGGGYEETQVLPSVAVTGNVAQTAYLLKDLLVPVGKNQGSTDNSNIYSQTGVNLISLDLTNTRQISAEIGSNLNITGGFLWAYDGTLLNEQGFHLWPEDITLTAGTDTDGFVGNGTYFYYVTYEWTDAQGNLMRSAPSVPSQIVMTGSNNQIILEIPTLRITYKNDVRIVVYRWSQAQQVAYQVTSIQNPTLNNPNVDSIEYIDKLADSSILGNVILYTTGGVVENLPGPATSSIGLFKSRLMLVPSEDPNTLWYSKQVLEATPVEMSDLFTVYAAPTLSSQGSTGPTLAVSALDDKFIAFKRDAIYYITGTGPDNTGAQNDFSDPVFITSTVGCANQPSIVFIPEGLVFQSDKGIWLLGRGLGTSYIGAPVEAYNNQDVVSAVGIPGTNQVRICLGNRITLMYDYYYQRWATFTNTPIVSSCLYQDLQAYLSSTDTILQETPNAYTDNGVPVNMAFTSAWFNLMGLQGFERAYMLYILGNYISPHTLSVTISYDYNNGPVQQVSINPTNYAGTWGSEALWGDGIWGGPGSLEQWRIFLQQQKIQAFQISLQESFDPSLGTAPGAGLTISGLNLVVGAKKGFVPLPASNSVG